MIVFFPFAITSAMKCSLPDLDLSDRLDDRCLGAPCAHTGTAAAAATVASLQKTQLGLADVHEDTPVAQDNDDERQQHADRDVEQRVVVRQGAVPETLLQLGS